MRVCVRVCVCACVRESVRACVRACVYACSRYLFSKQCAADKTHRLLIKDPPQYDMSVEMGTPNRDFLTKVPDTTVHN